MDNVTHSLIGTLLGRALPLKDQRLRGACIWTAVIGSNLPDIDIIIQPLIGQGRLGGMLHHRGYTHTLLAAPFLGFLAALLGIWMGRLNRKSLDQKTKIYLVVLGIFAVVFHILADYCNNYGVHPFAPFGNRWYYGDFIFILEPFLWLAILPLVALESVHILIRRFAWFLTAGILCAAWLIPQVPKSITLVLTLWALVAFLAQKKIRGVFIGFFGLSAVVMVFFVASYQAKVSIKNILKNAAPQETLVDLSITPSPANPFCWQVNALSVSSDYIVRFGGFSLWPTFFLPSECTLRADAKRTAPAMPVTMVLPESSFPSLRWTEEFRGKIEDFRGLAQKNCRFAAFLRFSRFPFWTQTPEGFVAGDLRYDREAGLGFSEILIDDPAFVNRCPSLVPPWETPVFLYLKGLFT